MATEKNNRAISHDERDRASLEAWCEWKRICSIRGCEKQKRDLLAKEVAKAFDRKLTEALGENRWWLLGDLKPKPKEGSKQEGEEEEEDEKTRKKRKEEEEERIHELAHEFDCGIIEKADLAKTKRNYKDYVWQKIKESNDPPLKVIRGLLFGGRKDSKHFCFINLIVDNWLIAKGLQVSSRKNPRTGKRVRIWYKPESADGIIYKVGNNKDSDDFSGSLCTWEDMGSFDSYVENLEYEKAFRGVFDIADAAILLSKAYGISVTTDKELFAFTGLSKSAISKRMLDYKNKLKTKLDKEVVEELDADNPCAASAMFSTLVKILCECESEPTSGRDFLSYVESKAAEHDLRTASRGGKSRPLPQFEGKDDFYSQPIGGNPAK